MSHNSNDGLEPVTAVQPDLPFKLAGTYAKTAKAIGLNIERMVREDGIETLLFATFTVGDEDSTLGFVQCWDHAEGSRRVNSLSTGLLSDVFKRWVLVTERHRNGAIHFHLVGSLASGADVRTGFDHEAVKRGDYSSASKPLRDLWALMRERLPGYGFGRAQLTPIKSTGEAIANYVGKYIEKNLYNRLPEDRKKKLARYGGWNRSHCRACDIAWVTPRATRWRENARDVAGIAMIEHHEAKQILGPRWAWTLTAIMQGQRWGWDTELMKAMMRELERRSEENQRGVELSLDDAQRESEALQAEGGEYFDPWRAAAA